MPVTTRKMSERRRQEEEQKYGQIDDRVATCCMMYPVFCTARIPSDILDEFIDQSYAGILDLLAPHIVDPGASPCILQTTDLDLIAHGSRKPMPNFESPFLNWTDEQVRDWATKEGKRQRQSFAMETFTILDQNSIDNKICRIGYIDNGEEDDDRRMLHGIFYADLQTRIPLNEVEVSWSETIPLMEETGVFDWTVMAKEQAEIDQVLERKKTMHVTKRLHN
ncbi:hypothetical protein MGYG_02283 [Nannizzia gypsea CBS 118893]|uniref:Uncharacterized protein n=1 Tax=Arthroderma gypseum (strain ATCC MYA-4604 / CBS 118893) TaxID=535722 RepID=E4UQU4_ARTGP|nr:hypothetical protein MGYG_02283 [Nannizzia gypsea CBS 118893]EFQ99270.1 hypothetical protein MGYG_02283 [Nannizzia gypsea CBS 118893]